MLPPPSLSPMERQLLERQSDLAQAILQRFDTLQDRQQRIEETLLVQSRQLAALDQKIQALTRWLMAIPTDRAG